MIELHNLSFEYMTDIVSLEVVETLRDARKRQISAASGYICFPTLEKDIHFESSVERDFLLCCRLDPQIVNVTDQPFSIRFTHRDGKKPLRYTPDFLVEKDFSKPEGQCAIGSPQTRFTLFEVKREKDLKQRKEKSIQYIAAGHKWAEQSADRSFSVMTDKVMFGDFGKYFRLMSGLVIQPFDKTTNMIEAMYSVPGKEPTVGEIIDRLAARNVSHEDAHNAIWKLIAKSTLQPNQLGELRRSDYLDYDARHSGGLIGS